MLSRAVPLIALTLAVVSGAGCSASGSRGGPTVVSPRGEPVTLDIFSARGFLGGSEYERYYLSDGLLWRECGSIAKGKKDPSAHPRPAKLAGDSVLKVDPQLSLQERRVERLTSQQVATLSRQVADLLDKSPETSAFPAPGSVFSLSDPGVFELLVHLGSSQQRVITSVDAVADRSNAALDAAHDLFATIRGVGPEICNARTFYGIERAGADGPAKKPAEDGSVP